MNNNNSKISTYESNYAAISFIYKTAQIAYISIIY